MANGQKLPWHKNYHDWWLRDLQEHPLEIEGAWNRICNKMWSDPDCPGTLEWPLFRWARLLGVTVEETLEILAYIQAEGIGDVKPANGDPNADSNGEEIPSFPNSQAELPDGEDQPNADSIAEHNGIPNAFPNAFPNANLTLTKCNSNADPNALVTVTSRHIARNRKALIANRLRQRRHYVKRKDERQPNAPSEGRSNATEDRSKNKEEEGGKKPQQLFPEKGPECDEVLRLFNTLCRPPIRPERGARLTPGRKLHIQARWKSPLFARWPGGPLECFRALFETAAQSELLNGRVRPKKPGQKSFRADLDWLLTEEHATKTLEGKYTDLPAGSGIEAAGEEPGEDVDEQIRKNAQEALKRRAELDTKHHATA